MSNSTKDVFSDDAGLRFKSKVSGSVFKTGTHGANSTMSCFRCGRHKPRDQLIGKKYLGKVQLVCAEKCT